MSLNFPTAFWKTDALPVAEDLDITWTTALASSYAAYDTLPGYDNYKLNQPVDELGSPIVPQGEAQNFPWTIGDTNNVPFVTIDGNGAQDFFYFYYEGHNWQGDTENVGKAAYWTPYFGWRQDEEGTYDGTYINFAEFHEPNPWKVKVPSDGTHEIQLFFESDYSTALCTGTGGEEEPTKQDWDITHPAGPWAFQVFNNFIQSGDATGTFDISSAQAGKTLQVKVSGLAEDVLPTLVNLGMEPASGYDAMTLYLEHPNESNDFICSGKAPTDERNVRSLGENYDQQQIKLYAGSDLSTIVNAQSVYANAGEGQPRGTTSEDVDQNKRDWPARYVTSNGVGTFTVTNLTAGNGYKIKIKASTIDGIFNSGSFYGFEFSLIN